MKVLMVDDEPLILNTGITPGAYREGDRVTEENDEGEWATKNNADVTAGSEEQLNSRIVQTGLISNSGRKG